MAYKNGRFRDKQSFETKYALDDLFNDSDKPKFYVFSPLHYLERNFGYLVFVDSDFPVANILYVNWLINIGNSLENIRRQSLLKNAMNRLDEMYIRDSLTDVYNRFGMERFFAEIKRKCVMSDVSMQLSFMDVDKLKEINDTYGHEEGDRIINVAAGILQKCAGKNYVIRYGGDEFLVMGVAQDITDIESYWKSVEQEVAEFNATTQKQAKLSISYGYELFNVDATTYLEDCVRMVDKKMYEFKNSRRK